ncbi:MAG TPA: hypothetical protein VMV83_10725 [Rectinemataceae bacterium]|nr:hypothetical protein [Rectinemataceae bacterium]
MKHCSGIAAFAALTLALGAVSLGAQEMGGAGNASDLGPFTATISFMEGTAKTGGATLMVKLADAMGAPVDGATLTATATMDKSMAMDSKTMDEAKPIQVGLEKNSEAGKQGEYMAKVDFPYDGKWTVEVRAARGTDSGTANFGVEVAKAGPNLAVVGGFLALIALVILAAGVAKTRRSKRPAATAA